MLTGATAAVVGKVEGFKDGAAVVRATGAFVRPLVLGWKDGFGEGSNVGLAVGVVGAGVGQEVGAVE